MTITGPDVMAENWVKTLDLIRQAGPCGLTHPLPAISHVAVPEGRLGMPRGSKLFFQKDNCR
jgi:hypothetical protein